MIILTYLLISSFVGFFSHHLGLSAIYLTAQITKHTHYTFTYRKVKIKQETKKHKIFYHLKPHG